jgi:SAM-dependent methyltransferase
MLERGKDLAIKAGLIDKFVFLYTDINSWVIDNTYDAIIANHSLHHFVELEVLFDKIYEALHPEGFFMTHDMIGKNGHMRWPEALEFVNAFWSVLDDRHKYNHQLKRFEATFDNWDCSKEGFEGIRSQDILPLLLEKFKFNLFVGFSNLIYIFIDRSFGYNFDLNNTWDKTFIDLVARLDDYFIESGRIKPIQMFAVMTREQKEPTKTYKHLTPEFCVRMPEKIETCGVLRNKTQSFFTKLFKSS